MLQAGQRPRLIATLERPARFDCFRDMPRLRRCEARIKHYPMAPRHNPLGLNALQLKTLTLLQQLARLPDFSRPGEEPGPSC